MIGDCAYSPDDATLEHTLHTLYYGVGIAVTDVGNLGVRRVVQWQTRLGGLQDFPIEFVDDHAALFQRTGNRAGTDSTIAFELQP